MKINVLGSGYMGKQICSLFVILGHEVVIWQNTAKNLNNLINTEIIKLEKHFNLKSTGKYTIEQNISNLEENITIETVKEDLEIKKKIISKLKFKTNIFSNTSSINLSLLGNNVNGFHFMNPITLPLIELCIKGQYSENLLNQLLISLKKISYNIINVSDKSGFLVNRILFREISYFFYLYEVEKIDKKNLKSIYKLVNNNFDPIKIINMIGLDISLKIMENLNMDNKEIYIPNTLKNAVKNGLLGYKNKKILRI